MRFVQAGFPEQMYRITTTNVPFSWPWPISLPLPEDMFRRHIACWYIIWQCDTLVVVTDSAAVIFSGFPEQMYSRQLLITVRRKCWFVPVPVAMKSWQQLNVLAVVVAQFLLTVHTVDYVCMLKTSYFQFWTSLKPGNCSYTFSLCTFLSESLLHFAEQWWLSFAENGGPWECETAVRRCTYIGPNRSWRLCIPVSCPPCRRTCRAPAVMSSRRGRAPTCWRAFSVPSCAHERSRTAPSWRRQP